MAQRGSVMQLALAVLVTLSYLAVQLHAQPYRDRTNDYLALLSSFNQTLVFVTSVFYKYQTLSEASRRTWVSHAAAAASADRRAVVASLRTAELDDIKIKLSDEQKTTFDVYAVALSFMLMSSIIGVLVGCLAILLVHMAVDAREERRRRMWRLRYRGAGGRATDDAKAVTLRPPRDPHLYEYDLFLSHKQQQGGDQMRVVKQRLITELLPNARVFRG